MKRRRKLARWKEHLHGHDAWTWTRVDRDGGFRVRRECRADHRAHAGLCVVERRRAQGRARRDAIDNMSTGASWLAVARHFAAER